MKACLVLVWRFICGDKGCRQERVSNHFSACIHIVTQGTYDQSQRWNQGQSSKGFSIPHGCVALVHGNFRDVRAMSVQTRIRVDIRKSREVLTVECAYFCLALTGINVIGAVKMLKNEHEIRIVLYC